MAGYGNYYSSQYMYQPTQPQSYPQWAGQSMSPVGYQTAQVSRNNTGIVWVQGESGAKSQYVEAGQSALFMDSEKPVFYIKTVDLNGKPLSLQIFDFKERVVEQPQQQVEVGQTELPEYITRDEFEKRLSELTIEKKTTSTTKKGTKK